MITRTREEARWMTQSLIFRALEGVTTTSVVLIRLSLEFESLLMMGFQEDELVVTGEDLGSYMFDDGERVMCGSDWHVHPTIFDV